eukprot:4332264-Amphidinium_carterae.1
MISCCSSTTIDILFVWSLPTPLPSRRLVISGGFASLSFALVISQSRPPFGGKLGTGCPSSVVEGCQSVPDLQE